MKGCIGIPWEESCLFGRRHPHIVKRCPFPNYIN
jgi:hypothetical protein